MSVCLVAIPIALAMRAVMGEKKFNAWIESNSVRFATNFKNSKDLVQTVKLAGYDVIDWGGRYKTHIDTQLWFIWEQYEGKWQANFNKSDDTEKIRAFFRDLQHKSNRQILYIAPQRTRVQTASQQTRVAPPQPKVEPVISQKLPTIYTDRDLLLNTIQKYGATQVQVRGLDVTCSIDGVQLEFQQTAPGATYELSFGQQNSHSVYETIRRLDEGYRSTVQEKTYENVKKKLDEKNFVIEDEEIMEDNSIVLTVSI